MLPILRYMVCLKYHQQHPRNGENDQGAPGESGSCSHMVGRSRSTTQVRQMCISVVYSEIPWLQDHGTRSPTNGGWSQSSANAPAPQDVSQLKSIIGLISHYVWQISARFIQCSCSPLQIITEETCECLLAHYNLALSPSPFEKSEKRACYPLFAHAPNFPMFRKFRIIPCYPMCHDVRYV